MPRKWIFFQVVAGLLALVNIPCIGFFSYRLFFRKGYQILSDTDLLFGYSCLTGFISYLIFAVMSVILLQSKFPDRKISRRFLICFRIISVLYVIATICVMVLFVYGLSEEIRERGTREKEDNTGIYVLAGLAAFTGLLVYFFVAAQKLTGSIRRNFIAHEHEAIDSLGNNAADFSSLPGY